MKTGAELIADERARQIAKEGWTPAHDDGHVDGEIAQAAIAYAIGAIGDKDGAEVWWPWSDGPIKLKTPILDLVRAGALIAAEIDRLQRAAGEGKL